MIIQLGVAFSNLLNIGANKLISGVLPAALNIGTQFVSGIVNRELTRAQRNDSDDAFKSLIRAAANAVSPTAALGQTAVPAGGPATGTAFAPPTLVPPSIQPPQRVLQTNPDFFPRNATFTESRRPTTLAFNPAASIPATTNVGLLSTGVGVARRLGQAFNPRTPIGRRMLGAGAGAVALETGAQVGLGALFPGAAFAPGRNGGGFPASGNPLRIGDGMPVAPPATGLPGVGRFQKEANGCLVQWYFWDGTGSPQPIDRSQANCFRKDCIFRLDVFRGKFVKMGSRRMNPMNVRAFFRAGRRVDAGERICRKMFSEKRKQKTGTVRRKSKHKKK